MYYKGSPFVKEKALNSIEVHKTPIIYEDTFCNTDIAETIIERKNNGVIDYVFYINVKVDNYALWFFHKNKYGAIFYFKEDFLTKNIVKQAAFQQGTLESFKITIYSDDWLELKEQIFNANYELIEYHEFFYKENENTFYTERIFYAKNWILHKEEFLV